MEYCDNSTWARIVPKNFGEDAEKLINYYVYYSPIILIECLISVLLNTFIVVVGISKIKRKSPTLRLSLNLAATDGIASFTSGLGIFVGSYLPTVYQISPNSCVLLVVEIFRGASLVASALHLLALAFLHYTGIVHPLRYRYDVKYNPDSFAWIFPFVIV